MEQTIGLDTLVFIYALEYDPKFAHRAEKVLASVEAGKYNACFSVIGIVELLTGPKALGLPNVAEDYKQRLQRFPNLEILDIGHAVVDIASDLCAKYRLRVPDAIHIATAISCGATFFVTNDRALKKVKEIPVKFLHEVP